jgi:hypothetical protein
LALLTKLAELESRVNAITARLRRSVTEIPPMHHVLTQLTAIPAGSANSAFLRVLNAP